MANEDVPCYVAFAPCGCLTGASVDDGQYPKSTAKDVAEWIRDGYSVERKTVEFVRTNPFGHQFGCSKHKPRPAEEPILQPTLL